MKTNKGNTMIDLNTSQKEQVSVLYNHYKTDTVTRAEINSLVSKKKLKKHKLYCIIQLGILPV